MPTTLLREKILPKLLTWLDTGKPVTEANSADIKTAVESIESLTSGAGIPTYTSDSAAMDAFGRTRVSNPETLFDSKLVNDAAPLYWDQAQTAGGGTATAHSTATACTTISVSANTAGTRVRQTFQRFNYQPGKSQLVMRTFCFKSHAAGVTRRTGIFDANNGIFLTKLPGNTGAALTIRTSTSGSPSDTATVNQSAWNIDPLDGTGPSGVTANWLTVQILFLDFEWLGVGRVRVGFVINGQVVPVHEFNHANSSTVVYMSTPNLPLRDEIIASGTNDAAGFDLICSTVISEGGRERTGAEFGFDCGNTHLDANTGGTTYCALALRKKSTHLGADIMVTYISMMGTTVNDSWRWQIRLNPTIAGSPSYSSIDTNSALEGVIGATANTVTGGTVLMSGYGKSETENLTQTASDLRIGSSIANVPDVLALCIMPTGTGAVNLDIYSSINWHESN